MLTRAKLFQDVWHYKFLPALREQLAASIALKKNLMASVRLSPI
jgi:hypothetical protein